MAESDIFNDQDDHNKPQDPPANPDPDKREGDDVPRDPNPVDQLLDGIKNEKGERKYASAEDAFKALTASQEHIQRLEQENADYRERVTKATTMEEIMAAVKPKDEPRDAPVNQDRSKASDESVDIKGLVGEAIQEIEAKRTAKSNIETVTSKLKELYGDKASETFYEKSKEVGLSKEDVNSLASRSPSAVFRLLGVDDKPRPKHNPEGVRTDGFQQQAERPTKSAMSFGTSDDLVDAWRSVAEKVNKRLGVTQ